MGEEIDIYIYFLVRKHENLDDLNHAKSNIRTVFQTPNGGKFCFLRSGWQFVYMCLHERDRHTDRQTDTEREAETGIMSSLGFLCASL